jgi:HK97 family phage prohead protease
VVVVRPIEELLEIRTGIPAVEIRSKMDGTRSDPRCWNAPLIVTRSEKTEARATDEDEQAPAGAGEMRLRGYSAVFDSDSELLFGFVREQIKRGAFKNVLKRGPDVRLLENHEGRPHARTTNGTLKLEEKPRGLFRDALLDSRRQDSRDLYHGVERGDYSQSSFAFTVARDEWRTCGCVEQDNYAGCSCEWERDIREIGELLDDSVVTYPAYPDTTVTVARENETEGERAALASDEEQRDTAPDGDASTSVDASDPDENAVLLRQWLLTQGVTNESGTEGGATARY